MKKLFLILPFALLSTGGFAQLFKSKPQTTQCTTHATNLLLTSIALNSLWEDTPQEPPLNYHQGIAITETNDTLSGNIRLNPKYNISIITKRNGLNIDTTIEVADIKLVRLFAADSLLNNGTCTDYVRMENNNYYLWRQVYKGSFEIYDDLYAANEKPGETGGYLLIKDGQTTKEIAGFWTTFPKKKIIEYVNGRYAKNFSNKDFSSVVDVINWLKLNG